MKAKSRQSKDDLRPEYEFDYKAAVRGKYVKRLIEEGSNIAVLEPDVAKVFTDSKSVNDALRSIIEIAKTTRLLTNRANRKTRAEERETKVK